jgi:hypothetical protein
MIGNWEELEESESEELELLLGEDILIRVRIWVGLEGKEGVCSRYRRA